MRNTEETDVSKTWVIKETEQIHTILKPNEKVNTYNKEKKNNTVIWVTVNVGYKANGPLIENS